MSMSKPKRYIHGRFPHATGTDRHLTHNPTVKATYQARTVLALAALIAPNAPFVIAGCGFDGWNAAGGQLAVINAQLAAADPAKHPEFAGNVRTMECRGYWRDVAASPISQGLSLQPQPRAPRIP